MRSLTRALAVAALLAAPCALWAQEAYSTRTIGVRAGPDAGYPVVVTLAPGTPVEVLGCLDDYSWCDVAWGPERGWAYAAYLAAPYRQRRVPLLGYGAAIGVPIVVYSASRYWDDHYRERPWYRERNRWVDRSPPPYRPRDGGGRSGYRPDDRPGYRPDDRPGYRDDRPGYRPDDRPGYRPDDRRDGGPRGRADDGSGRRDDGRPSVRPPGRPEPVPPAAQPPVARPPAPAPRPPDRDRPAPDDHRPGGGMGPPSAGESPAGGPPGGGR